MLDELLDKLVEYERDPLGYAMFAYPWGETGELKRFSAPDQWQMDVLAYIGEELRAGRNVVRVAIKAGHGVGKSALSSMVTDWGMSTFPGTRGIITAGTERQLRTRTWVELNKWRRLSITKDLFTTRQTSLHTADKSMANEWRFDMSPWSANNTEAFAGLHNQGKRLLLLMDEGSAIDDLVFEVAEGALTDEDTQIIWVVMGNPTRQTGRFRECFDGGKFAHRWKQFTVDSRAARSTNKAQLEQYVTDYGINSDFTRVRVLGEFPLRDVSGFIARDLVEQALARELISGADAGQPVILGVDVARFGDDASVIYPRQGSDARSRLIERYSKLDTMQLADKVAACATRYAADMIYVDETGLGAGVVDRLRQLRYRVTGVNFSGGADSGASGEKYFNKRAEIWGSLRDKLSTLCLQHFAVDNDRSMVDDLTVTNYSFTPKDEIILEKKADIKSREGWSPDIGDALALTFAFPHLAIAGRRTAPQSTYKNSTTYNPYAQVYS